MRVLVTGANGFVGRALCGELRRHQWHVVAAVRRKANVPEDCEACLIGDVGPDSDWAVCLDGVETIAHLAARVHVMREDAADPLAAYRRTNVEGSLNLARAAVRAGVKRLVFLSSVKAMGESSLDGPLTEAAPPDPEDPYGVSKLEAEAGLVRVAGELGLELVILRPPLVYGPGVKGNFRSLLRLVDRGIPLPLGAIRNRRSFLYVGNLVAAIRLCLEHSAAPGGTFLLRDGEDLSTSDLIGHLASTLGRRATLFSVPHSLLKLAAGCLGKGSEVERLLGSLAIDDHRIRQELGWRPPFTVEAGLAETARWYRENGV